MAANMLDGLTTCWDTNGSKPTVRFDLNGDRGDNAILLDLHPAPAVPDLHAAFMPPPMPGEFPPPLPSSTPSFTSPPTVNKMTNVVVEDVSDDEYSIGSASSGSRLVNRAP